MSSMSARRISRPLGSTTGSQRAVGAGGHRKTPTVAQVVVERIIATYSREQAAQDGIYFWPDPLPTPVDTRLPDPLVLFKTAIDSATTSPLSTIQSLIEEQRERIPVLPLTLHEAAAFRSKECFLNIMLSQGKDKAPDGPMRFPLGLVDIPADQRRDIFCVDLHGSAGALSGGPLLIAGAQNSGKATALQTILLWLVTRYTPRQLRCAVIDPSHDLDFFQDSPYVRGSDGSPIWTDGNTDEQLSQFAERLTRFLTQRRESYPNHRWDEHTVMHLRARGAELPALLLIISHYHSFAERFKAMDILKKLVLTLAEARAMGVYIILTSAEVSTKYVPAELMGKMGTKIGLFLNDQQRYDLFGRTPGTIEPIPGRGLVLTRDRSMHEIQIALPLPGATEAVRHEALKQEMAWLYSTLDSVMNDAIM